MAAKKRLNLHTEVEWARDFHKKIEKNRGHGKKADIVGRKERISRERKISRRLRKEKVGISRPVNFGGKRIPGNIVDFCLYHFPARSFQGNRGQVFTESAFEHMKEVYDFSKRTKKLKGQRLLDIVQKKGCTTAIIDGDCRFSIVDGDRRMYIPVKHKMFRNVNSENGSWEDQSDSDFLLMVPDIFDSYKGSSIFYESSRSSLFYLKVDNEDGKRFHYQLILGDSAVNKKYQLGFNISRNPMRVTNKDRCLI